MEWRFLRVVHRRLSCDFWIRDHFNLHALRVPDASQKPTVDLVEKLRAVPSRTLMLSVQGGFR